MKRLIATIALLASMTSAAFADIDATKYPVAARVRVAFTNEMATGGRSAGPAYINNLSAEDKDVYFTQTVAAVDEFIAAEDLKGAEALLRNPDLFSPAWNHDDDMEALDIRWAEAGVRMFDFNSLNVYRRAHRLMDATFNANDGRGEYIRRHYTVVYTMITNQAATTTEAKFTYTNPPMYANRLYEQIASYSIQPSEIPENIKRVCKDVVPAIKMSLRKQGKTFIVGPDGINPVQEAVDQLTAAFQAPRLAGVKEWFAAYYPDYVWIDPVVDEYTDEQVASLKDKVFYGQVELTKAVSTKLLYLLGLDGYNEFIERYNK